MVVTSERASAGPLEDSNDTNVTIPDNGDWVNSSCHTLGAPEGSVITEVAVYVEIRHTYIGDLQVDLDTDPIGVTWTIHQREGGTADDIVGWYSNETDFDWMDPNQTWDLWVIDEAPMDTGYIDSWTILVYYSDGTPPGPAPGDGVQTCRGLLIDAYGMNSDVYGLRDALLGSRDGRWVSANIALLEYGSATVSNVNVALSDLLSTCDADDLALVYFTCHGDALSDVGQGDEGDGLDGVLVMDDGDIRDDTLGAWLGYFANGDYPLDSFCLIVDACYSGEFLDGGSSDPTSTLPDHVIMSASQADELASGGTPYSEFTAALIDAMSDDASEADGNGDGRVAAEEAFAWADGHVFEQDPEISDSFVGVLDLVSYRIGPTPGDANGDGAVTDADYTIWADHYGMASATFAMGDFNDDGNVTDADYTIWADHYGSIAGGSGSAAQSSPALVVEREPRGRAVAMEAVEEASNARERDEPIGAGPPRVAGLADPERDAIDLLAILSSPELLV
jgi:subtilisin-like proprotein convertase family protein